MIRLSKKTAAKMGFISKTIDIETEKRLAKKVDTQIKTFFKKEKKTVYHSPKKNDCDLIRVSESRYIVDLKGAV
jgi:hypothetical protein